MKNMMQNNPSIVTTASSSPYSTPPSGLIAKINGYMTLLKSHGDYMKTFEEREREYQNALLTFFPTFEVFEENRSMIRDIMLTHWKATPEQLAIISGADILKRNSRAMLSRVSRKTYSSSPRLPIVAPLARQTDIC
jgi:hypothetical protein